MASKALTTIQTALLISIIVVAGLGGVAAYVLLSGQDQSSEAIKIGILADLDGKYGKATWQGAIMAAEQINAEGGILGRTVEIVGEDTDQESGATDIAIITSALNRLLSVHKVDYIYSGVGGAYAIRVQSIIADHKTITFSSDNTDELTERVLDDYDTYKYFFRVAFNWSSAKQGITDSLLLLREQTGFNKVGYLAEWWTTEFREGVDYLWPEVHEFDLVYKGVFPMGTVDFTSYFAQAEAAGVEILVPLVAFDGGIPLTKEWYNRQSPMLVSCGVLTSASEPESWEQLDGKCEFMGVSTLPIVAGYPLTSRTLPAREAYINRWDETPGWAAANAYDPLRFILPDAIERAGTTETEAVIEALEETSIETTATVNFVFTSSHDVMMGENPNDPDADFMLVMVFQWQNGEMVPVYPEKIMKRAGVTLTFPDWPGPWD